MYQAEMFTNPLRNAVLLGEGCFAKAWSLDADWVLKQARERDGTLNYLEWCLLMQAAGKGMKGMPEIDRLCHTEHGYIVCMRRYQHQSEGIEHIGRYDYYSGYVMELTKAFQQHMKEVFDGYDYLDLHGGNIMYDKHGGCYVVTDPSSCAYQVADASCFAEPFTLH